MTETAILVLSFLSLIIISVFSFVVAKKIKFPYTLFLVLVGTALAFLSKIEIFSFLAEFKLTPELLFYVFLPTLLFEAGYNIKINKLLKSFRSIFSLAILGLLISTLVIGFGLTGILALFGIEIPLIVALLFGAIISATDPVAVIALFKEYSAPKRLSLIFEGESLFNDGTAVAMFLVLLGVIQFNDGILSAGSALSGLGIFVSMIILGIVFGIISGLLFSKALEYAKNEHLQITLALMVAHITFLLSEIALEHYQIYISGIIATVVASIVVGNYGRYKLTPRVEKYTDHFWEYFSFIVNSIVFILLGFLLTGIDFSNSAIYLPMATAILIAMVARAVGVYLSLYWLKFQKQEKEIPNSWKILLSWGSLRGALAIIMVLMIPDNLTMSGWNYPLSIKEFIMVVVVASIYFTLFVKGLSIGRVMKKLNISKIGNYDQMEYLEGKAYLYFNLLEKLKAELANDNLELIDYQNKESEILKKIKKAKKEFLEYAGKNPLFLKRSLAQYIIGLEKNILNEIYSNKEITEKGYKKYLNKLELKEENLEDFKIVDSLENISNNHLIDNFLKKIDEIIFHKDYLSAFDKYLYYRALEITSKKVIEVLHKISGPGGIFEKNKDLEKYLIKYENFKIQSKNKRKELLKNKPELKDKCQNFNNNQILNLENEILAEMKKNNLIGEKVSTTLKKDFLI